MKFDCTGVRRSGFYRFARSILLSALREGQTVCAIAMSWSDEDAAVPLPRHGSKDGSAMVSRSPEIKKNPSPDALDRV